MPPQVPTEGRARAEDAGGSLQQHLRTEKRLCPYSNVLIVFEKEPTCELELLNKARSSICRSRSGHVHPSFRVAASDISGLTLIPIRDVLLQQCER